MDLTGWLFLNSGQNHLVRKTMVDLVVHHIEFAHIQPPNMVLILMRVFKVGFTGWSFFNRGQNYLVRKIIVVLVAHHIEFAHI